MHKRVLHAHISSAVYTGSLVTRSIWSFCQSILWNPNPLDWVLSPRNHWWKMKSRRRRSRRIQKKKTTTRPSNGVFHACTFNAVHDFLCCILVNTATTLKNRFGIVMVTKLLHPSFFYVVASFLSQHLLYIFSNWR